MIYQCLFFKLHQINQNEIYYKNKQDKRNEWISVAFTFNEQLVKNNLNIHAIIKLGWKRKRKKTFECVSFDECLWNCWT